MSLTRTVLTDRTGLLTTVGGLAAGLDHPALVAVVGLRLLLPVLLVLHAGRGATPAQRISLVRDYLCVAGTGAVPPSVSSGRHGPATGPSENGGRRDEEG